MALIEIPNVYHCDAAAGAAGRSRFAVIGEPVVGVDLINTVGVPGSAVADDLLSADGGAQAWWRIERARVLAHLSRFAEASRLYQQVLDDWANRSSRYTLAREVREEYAKLTGTQAHIQGEKR